MKSEAKIAIGAAAVVLIGVGLIVGLRTQVETSSPLESSAAPIIDAAAAEAPQATQTDLAPWESGPTGAAAAAGTSPGGFPATMPPRLPTADAATTVAIAQMKRQMEQNEVQAQMVLRQLDTAQATGSLPAHINIEAARQNIHIALKAQQLGRDLVELTQQARTPERQQKITELTNQLAGLRDQLRLDMHTTSAANASP